MHQSKRIGATALLGLLLINATPANSDATRDALPIPGPTYDNVNLGKTVASSDRGHYLTGVKAPANAPNMILVLTDDAGFASSSAFGGAVPTPTLGALADSGLRYNRFHTTGVCSPTRAALLTGRNHHAVGLGSLTEMALPYPGYTGEIARSAVSIARILTENGYNTAMFGKDHNVPHSQRSVTGPFYNWPTGPIRGFEYFYGFITGDVHQWRPALVENTVPLDDSARKKDYLFDEEMSDRAINWIHNQQAVAPDKPFFMYLSYGSPHAPHHAPMDWIKRFQGRFDAGWDVERDRLFRQQQTLGIIPAEAQLTPRPSEVPAWDSLSRNEQKIQARMMEVFAAQLAFQDFQFGRLVKELERMGLRDDTVIVFVEGDNGASGEAGAPGTLNGMALLSSGQEYWPDQDWLVANLDVLGGPQTYQSYGVGWTWAMNTPFPWFKQHASHLGGVRNGMVVSWPAGIKQTGEIRSQYHHVIDVVPTLLEISGIPAPTTVDGVTQQPMDGLSMAYSFEQPDAPSVRQTQYYEVNGNHGVYHDGWLANTTPRHMPWGVAELRDSSDTSSYQWELYHLDQDFSQANNLAAAEPAKLAQMKAVFDAEAERNKVFPISDSGAKTRAMNRIRATSDGFRSDYVFWGSNIKVAMAQAPPIFHMPFTTEAELEVPDEHSNGVIWAMGSALGGWSFYLKDGYPVIANARSPLPGGETRAQSPVRLDAGTHRLGFQFTPAGAGGHAIITLDGKTVLDTMLANRPLALAGNGETFDTGRDSFVAVTDDYQHEGVLEGTLTKLTVRVQLPQRPD